MSSSKNTASAREPTEQDDPTGTISGLITCLERLADTKGEKEKKDVLAELSEIQRFAPKAQGGWVEGGKLLRPLLEAGEDYLAEQTNENIAKFKIMATRIFTMLKERKYA